MAHGSENVMSPAEYQSKLRDSKIKANMEKEKTKPKKAQSPHSKPVPENHSEDKSPKKSKKPKDSDYLPQPKKLSSAVQAVDVPFWQNDLFKPLAYVFGLVTLLSFLYLTLN